MDNLHNQTVIFRLSEVVVILILDDSLLSQTDQYIQGFNLFSFNVLFY